MRPRIDNSTFIKGTIDYQQHGTAGSFFATIMITRKGSHEHDGTVAMFLRADWSLD
jgi:hypothetical protein